MAPNIYYLGAAGVVNFGGVRIAGLSGIFNPRHYREVGLTSLPWPQQLAKHGFVQSPQSPTCISTWCGARKVTKSRTVWACQTLPLCSCTRSNAELRHAAQGHHERPPYTDGSMRSAYHVREVDAFRLAQVPSAKAVWDCHLAEPAEAPVC